MKSLNPHQKIFLAAAISLIGLVVLGLIIINNLDGYGTGSLNSPGGGTPDPSFDAQLTDTPDVISTPGMRIYGNVHDQTGAGVKDVVIYRNYASYPGEVIATTDASGNYASDFYPIPGDEMIGVWAEKSGLKFDPEYCRWRHYYGYERVECSFLAR